jgi:hypothetical protein
VNLDRGELLQEGLPKERLLAAAEDERRHLLDHLRSQRDSVDRHEVAMDAAPGALANDVVHPDGSGDPRRARVLL